jgi:hypothetical protein
MDLTDNDDPPYEPNESSDEISSPVRKKRKRASSRKSRVISDEKLTLEQYNR